MTAPTTAIDCTRVPRFVWVIALALGLNVVAWVGREWVSADG